MADPRIARKSPVFFWKWLILGSPIVFLFASHSLRCRQMSFKFGSHQKSCSQSATHHFTSGQKRSVLLKLRRQQQDIDQTIAPIQIFTPIAGWRNFGTTHENPRENIALANNLFKESMTFLIATMITHENLVLLSSSATMSSSIVLFFVSVSTSSR